MKKRVDVVETQSIQPSLQTAQLSLPRSLSNITPLQAFLERLLISLSEVGTQAKLKLYGVPEITAAILLEGSKCRTFVDQFIHGKFTSSVQGIRDEISRLDTLRSLV